jgi:hypothetical protein
MSGLDSQHGRVSEETPRLLALEPLIKGARVLWVGAAAEESLEWMHRLGASRVSIVGASVASGLRADVYLEPDGLSAVPSGRSDLIIFDDFAARLAAYPDLFTDVDRLLSPKGKIIGVLPSVGEHVGVDMLAHCEAVRRLSYGEVISQLESHFEHVIAVAQVPLLGYLITGTSDDRSLQFDGRLADLSDEPPIYHLVGGFREVPPPLNNRIATLSFDSLSDRVGQVVASLSQQSATTKLEANRALADLEESLEALQRECSAAQIEASSDKKITQQTEREHEALKARFNELEHRLVSEKKRLQNELKKSRESLTDAQTLGSSEGEKSLVLSQQCESLSARVSELDAQLSDEVHKRENDSTPSDLVKLRIAHQQAAAKAHRNSGLATRRQKEITELWGQLRRSQSQLRRNEHLLVEAQTRLESMSRQREADDQTEHLKHLQRQLAEALAQEESLDEERSLLKKQLTQAQSEIGVATGRRDELEDLVPQLARLQTHSSEIKAHLEDSRNQADEQRHLAEKNHEALRDALDREELIKGRSVELAEAVSNLAARVDLLEGETKSQLEALAELEDARDEALKSQREEAVLCKSLRQQLEDAQTQLAQRGGDDDRQRLRREISLLEERCDAAMDALQHQGAESAKHEQQHRQIELENQRLRASITARKEEPTQRVAELQQRIRNLDEEGQRLESELSSLRTRSEEQRQQLDEADILTSDVETLRSDRSALSSEVERLLPFEEQHLGLVDGRREQGELLALVEERLARSDKLNTELQRKLEISAQETDQARQDGEAQVRAALSEQQTRLAEAEQRISKSQKRSEVLLDELTVALAKQGDMQDRQSEMTDKSDLLAARGEAQRVEIKHDELQAKSRDTAHLLAQVQLTLSNLEAEFERSNDRWAAKRVTLEEHHDEELKMRLAQAGDISQAQIAKLESELAKQRSRAAAIEAQEEHIVELIDEQRRAADQAWSLAVAERNARFVSLVDRFGRVVQTIAEKEGHS